MPITQENIRNLVTNYNTQSVIDEHGPIGEWDVSQVTDMSMLFGGVPTFNENISKWNVSNVIDMDMMFSGARAFNQPLDSWDVSNVTDNEYIILD